MSDRLQSSPLQFIQSRPVIGIVILSAFYFFGIIGILFWSAEWFIEKTAFNLLLSFLILLAYQQSVNYRFWLAFLFCYLIGFLSEYLGVTYGIIFGDYYYPDTLGLQWHGVPLIIGVNWFLLTFCVWATLKKTRFPDVFLILPATIITVLIDVIIEPVAMALDFWEWENNVIPMQNYIGWAIISFLIFCFFALIKVPAKNRIHLILLAWQLLFFSTLNLFL